LPAESATREIIIVFLRAILGEVWLGNYFLTDGIYNPGDRIYSLIRRQS
jgi:hypothetical protein